MLDSNVSLTESLMPLMLARTSTNQQCVCPTSLSSYLISYLRSHNHAQSWTPIASESYAFNDMMGDRQFTDHTTTEQLASLHEFIHTRFNKHVHC